MSKLHNAELILENGRRFPGRSFGYTKETVGEVVFTTSMGGYQEMLTDPALCGQILVMTYPLVGNYGINLEDMESKSPSLNGLIVRQKCDFPSNFRNEMSLDGFLKHHRIMGLEGVDTREITRLVRDNGLMRGIITAQKPDDNQARRQMAELDNSDVVQRVTIHKKYVLKGGAKHIAFIDLGAKKSLLRHLNELGYKLTVLPANTDAAQILDIAPDVLFVSGGPGDPRDVPRTIAMVRELVGRVRICGIGLGHLVIALALDCEVSALKFGHHGGNHPVRDTATGRVYITAQGHNHVVSGIDGNVEITFTSMNDQTVEGIRHRSLPIESVQFNPEAAPGPLDTIHLLKRFVSERGDQ